MKVNTDPKTHTFASTGEAYDDCQTGYYPDGVELPSIDLPADEYHAAMDAALVVVADGDVLVVPSENVVGILTQAWPTAVTVEHGNFHLLDPETGATWASLSGITEADERRDYTESALLALREVARLATSAAEAAHKATHPFGAGDHALSSDGHPVEVVDTYEVEGIEFATIRYLDGHLPHAVGGRAAGTEDDPLWEHRVLDGEVVRSGGSYYDPRDWQIEGGLRKLDGSSPKQATDPRGDRGDHDCLTEGWLLDNLPEGWTYDCRFGHWFGGEEGQDGFTITASDGRTLFIPLDLLARERSTRS